MTTTRRDFLKVAALSSGALVLGFRCANADDSPASSPFQPNAWLRVEPDGRVVLVVGKSEMGQGVRTSLAMILAEELDVDLASVAIEQASPGPDYQRLGTGGSGSIMGSWNDLRTAGATGRAMLVAAAAARWKIAPDRCTTANGTVLDPETNRSLAYGALAAEAAKQPVPESPKLKAKAQFRLIGTSQKNVDGPDIVTGTAVYGIDVTRPGMLHATVARSPAFGGKLASFDPSAAMKVRGVKYCFPISSGVAVVADSTWAAIKGRKALKVEWTNGPDASFSSVAHMKVLETKAKEPGITTRKDGKGRDAIANAATTLEALYLYPFEAHASVEPVNSTAWVHDGVCEIWAPTQTPNGVQAQAARLLGIDPSKVTVHVTLLGGGFGRRLGWEFNNESVEIAKQAGVPVKLTWTREDDITHGYFQAASAHMLRAGLDASGRVVAWEHRKVTTPHNARRKPSDEDLKNPETLGSWSWGVNDTPYAVPSLETTYLPVMAPVPIGPWRSVFSPSSVFARECFIDEIAVKAKRDPLALRLEMLGKGDESIPTEVDLGYARIDRKRMRAVLELVARKSGWGGAPHAGHAFGLACNVFHTETYLAYVVEVALAKSRSSSELPFAVRRVVCAIDCGQVINPKGVAQQVESGVIWSLSNMKSEITFEKGRAEQSNFSDFPVLVMAETPIIETHIVESDDPSPHGIGEPTVCPLAPAVASALSRLAGKRVRRLPVRAEDLG
ncbi:MAG: molybdopterin cofactor-binding domain-containing protein [Thermoanaerobaculia bacterium]